MPIQPAWLSPHLPREGRYVLGPLLGKGGMGEVMEAWDVLLCRTVALKALRNMEPAALIRFMHEAQIQARVIHPNICRIYDIETSGRTLKIAMQLIKGPNLEQAAAQLTLEEAVTLIRQMAEAVHAAHRVNLIHRDLKPSNIILERGTEGRWTPYLCDFGLAVSVGDPPMTLSQVAVGTPAFMAPEQSRGGRDLISPATDVFALGGTLHFALLGYPPGHLGISAAPLGSRKPDLPRDLATVIGKCLEQDPARRYPTALALAADLDRFLRGVPVDARTRGPWDRMAGLLPRRGSRMLALGWFLAALGLTLAAGAGWTLRFRSREMARVRNLQMTNAGFLFSHAGELALPPHDLRPARARLRARMAEAVAQVKGAGPQARGVAWFALGQAHLLLEEEALAGAAFGKAAALGYEETLLAPLMIRALAEGCYWRPEQRPTAVEEHWARLALPASGTDLLHEGRTAFILGDYATAARLSREAGEKAWHSSEPAELEAAALCALGRRAYRSGEHAGARVLFQDAADTAGSRMEFWGSDSGLRHAFARASLAKVEIDLERGASGGEDLRALVQTCDETLRIDPGDRDLREDWLASRFLMARGRVLAGLDPRPVLKEALAFLASGEPDAGRPDGLRMALNWQVADWEFRHGRDPGPALAEALASFGPAAAFSRDYQTATLLLRARVEAARGRDPRPAVEDCLRHLGAAGTWDQAQAAAEAWYVRAEWEAANAVSPSDSVARIHAHADRALGSWAGAPDAHALKGLAFALEVRGDPSSRARLLPSARLHLRAARASGGGSGLVLDLERALPGSP